MLAAWWDHNMHGRRLIGHLAWVAALVVFAVAVGTYPRFDGAKDGPVVIWIASLGFIGALVGFLAKRTREAAFGLIGPAASSAGLIVGVLAVDAFVGSGPPGASIDMNTPILLVIILALVALSTYLIEEDPAKRRSGMLALAGLSVVGIGTFLGMEGGPFAPVGVALLVIVAASIVVVIVYRLVTTPPAFPGPGT